MIEVRSPQPRDRDFLVRLLDDTLAEAPMLDTVSRTATQLRRHVDALLDSENVLFVVAERDGEPIGAAFGQVTQFYGSDVEFVCDVSIGVAREHRSTTAAVRLLRELQDRAKARGCHSVTISNALGFAGDATDRLAEGLGYTGIGQVYRKLL